MIKKKQQQQTLKEEKRKQDLRKQQQDDPSFEQEQQQQQQKKNDNRNNRRSLTKSLYCYSSLFLLYLSVSFLTSPPHPSPPKCASLPPESPSQTSHPPPPATTKKENKQNKSKAAASHANIHCSHFLFLLHSISFPPHFSTSINPKMCLAVPGNLSLSNLSSPSTNGRKSFFICPTKSPSSLPLISAFVFNSVRSPSVFLTPAEEQARRISSGKTLPGPTPCCSSSSATAAAGVQVESLPRFDLPPRPLTPLEGWND